MVCSTVFLSGDCGGVSNGVVSLVGGGVKSIRGDVGDDGGFVGGDGGEGERVGDGESGDELSGLCFRHLWFEPCEVKEVVYGGGLREEDETVQRKKRVGSFRKRK